MNAAPKPLQVLSVEDDPFWREKIHLAAAKAQWRYRAVADLAAAKAALGVEPVDIVILDRMLGERSEGLDLVDWLRSIEAPMPGVIALSYLSEIDHQVFGLNRGVDDYLGKPFELDALIARVTAVSRRVTSFRTPISVEVIGDLELHTKARQAYWRGQQIPLQKKAYALLCAIATGKGDIVDIDTLWREVWTDYPGLPPQDTVMNTAVSRLRGYLNKVQDPPRIVRDGAGYRLCVE